MRTTRSLSRVARVVEKVTLRAGFRRLVASARRKDHEEAVRQGEGGDGGEVMNGRSDFSRFEP